MFLKNNHHGQAAPWKSAFSVFTNDKENMQKKRKKSLNLVWSPIYFLIYSDQSKNKIKTFMTTDKYSQLKLYPTKILFARGFYINLLSIT